MARGMCLCNAVAGGVCRCNLHAGLKITNGTGEVCQIIRFSFFLWVQFVLEAQGFPGLAGVWGAHTGGISPTGLADGEMSGPLIFRRFLIFCLDSFPM